MDHSNVAESAPCDGRSDAIGTVSATGSSEQPPRSGDGRAAGLCPAAARLTGRAIPLGPAWASNSVNMAIFRHHGIVTFGRFQFAAFYESEQSIAVVRRDLSSGALSRGRIEGNTDSSRRRCLAPG